MKNRKCIQHFVMLWLLLMTTSQAWTSCAVDDDMGAPNPSIDPALPVIYTMIRFEDADGGNLMSSVDDIRHDALYYPFKFEDTPWLDVRCIRGSDGAQMTYSEVSWHRPSDPDEVLVYGEGPVLILSWLDVDKLAGQNVTFPNRDSYTLHIRNTYVWPDEEHTIKWSVEYPTQYTFNVVACAIDGVDAPQRLLDATTDAGRFIGFVHLGREY